MGGAAVECSMGFRSRACPSSKPVAERGSRIASEHDVARTACNQCDRFDCSPSDGAESGELRLAQTGSLHENKPVHVRSTVGVLTRETVSRRVPFVMMSTQPPQEMRALNSLIESGRERLDDDQPAGAACRAPREVIPIVDALPIHIVA